MEDLTGFEKEIKSPKQYLGESHNSEWSAMFLFFLILNVTRLFFSSQKDVTVNMMEKTNFKIHALQMFGLVGQRTSCAKLRSTMGEVCMRE